MKTWSSSDKVFVSTLQLPKDIPIPHEPAPTLFHSPVSQRRTYFLPVAFAADLVTLPLDFSALIT